MSRRARAYIPLPERLAAALSRLLPPDVEKDMRARRVPALEVISLFHQDHIVLHALGGADLWWNIDPKLAEPHRIKSRRDTSIVAKVKRLEPAHEEFRRKVLAKPCGQKRQAKGQIRSRGFDKTKTRKFGGVVERRVASDTSMGNRKSDV